MKADAVRKGEKLQYAMRTHRLAECGQLRTSPEEKKGIQVVDINIIKAVVEAEAEASSMIIINYTCQQNEVQKTKSKEKIGMVRKQITEQSTR